MSGNSITRQHIKITSPRFWERVLCGADELCWPWRLKVNRDGYGIYSMAGSRVLAHRIAWASKNGADLPAGMVVMHTCDNPRCCNPAHLKLGTQTENIRDRDAKGRTPRGRAPMDQKPAPAAVAGDLNPRDIPKRYDPLTSDRTPRTSATTSELLAALMKKKAERRAKIKI